MSKFLKLVTIIAISFSSISCTKADDKVAMSPPLKQEDALPEYTAEVADLVTGQDISKELAGIRIKTSKDKEKNLKDVMGPDKTLFAVVKPGCIFCEAMLAVLSSTKPDVKPKLIFVMDKSHAGWDGFKKKANANKAIKAEWIFDKTDSFHHVLGAKSFPRLIVVDSKGIVIENQIGLVLPEDKSKLEGLAMPEALQLLSLRTIEWMKGL